MTEMKRLHLLHRADSILKELEHLLPVAYITGALEHWSGMYAEAYIMKLRMTR